MSLTSESNNIKIINTKKSKFKHYGFSEDNFCLVNIIIQEVEYIDTQKKYFYISYNFEYGKNSNIQSHPFYGNKEMLEDNCEGEILYKNDLSEKLVEYLLMDDKDLSDKTGLTTVWNYKASIMKMITHLWD